MYKTGQSCVVCGKGQLTRKVIQEVFEYKGKKKTVSNYCVYECNKCKEVLVDSKTIRSKEKILTDIRREIDGLLTSSEIVQIRKNLGKTQQEMAKIFGVGEKNFARYENGQVTQSKPMDNLLRVLDKYPIVLNIFKPEEKDLMSKDANFENQKSLSKENMDFATENNSEEYVLAA